MRWPLTTSDAVTNAKTTDRGVCVVAFALAGLTMVCPNEAFALGDYRDKVAAFAQVAPESVPCATCHDDPKGGGPKNRPFYLSLEQNGLNAQLALETIDGALASMSSSKVDSDRDAAEDLVELKAGTDPNDSASKPADGGGGAGGAPPPPPPPRAGSGGSNSGGRAGASPSPSAGSSGDENALESEGTTATCSFGGVNANGAGASALLVGLAFLTRVRSRRSRGS